MPRQPSVRHLESPPTALIAAGLLLAFGLGAAAVGCSGSSSGTPTGPAAPACAPGPGDCPNLCTSGDNEQDEICSTENDCACGLACKVINGVASCQPFDGDNEGCSCELPEPATGADGAGGDGTTPEPEPEPEPSGPDIDGDCPKLAPTGAACNPFCQLGCDADENCTYAFSNVLCQPQGQIGIGEPCAGDSSCEVGHACIGITDDPDGQTCKRFCITDDDCPEDRRCDLNVNFTAAAGELQMSFCGKITIGCDAFEQPSTVCAEEEACYYFQNSTSCQPAGSLEEGELCGEANDCAPGLQCLVECTEICSTTSAAEPLCNACPSGEFDVLEEDNGLGFCLTDEVPAACNPFGAESGCPGGEGCYLTTGGFGCIGINGEGNPPGSECTGSNSCETGSVCISNICLPSCTVDPNAPAEHQCETMCSSFGTLSPAIWQLGFCQDASPAVSCNFWDQDCADGKVCYPTSIGEACLDPTGQGSEGSPCSNNQGCAEGLVCPQFASECREACSVLEFPDAQDEDAVPICVDDCPNSAYEPIQFGSEIGACLSGG